MWPSFCIVVIGNPEVPFHFILLFYSYLNQLLICQMQLVYQQKWHHEGCLRHLFSKLFSEHRIDGPHDAITIDILNKQNELAIDIINVLNSSIIAQKITQK